MFLTVSLLFLLLSVPISEAQVAPAIFHTLTTLASGPGAIIKAAVPFNCEVTQAANAASAFTKLAQNLISTGAPANQGAINNLVTYAEQVMAWPLCWAAEGGRVAKAIAELLKSGVLG